MKSARVRLFLAASLFAGWLGWLTYLAVTTTTPLILSRPQFLRADLDVVAEVDGNDNQPYQAVTVVAVPWARAGTVPPKIQAALQVDGLEKLTRANGWQGPNRYLLPLKYGDGRFKLTEIGQSPGYPPRAKTDGGGGPSGEAGRVRMYLDTSETRQQERNIRAGIWN